MDKGGNGKKLVTVEDLQQFKVELLWDIKAAGS
jgi:hypothetical protein